LYPTHNFRTITSRGMRWVKHVIMGERNVQNILVGRLKGKKPRGRPRRRWDDNIKLGLKLGCEIVDPIHLAQDRNR